MELPQTHIIIGQLRRKIDQHDIYKSSVKCIPKQCSEIISSNNCSCQKNFTNVPCPEDDPDSNIPVILWSLSALIVGILILEIVAIRFGRSYLKNVIGKMVFCMGVVTSVVTQLCTIPYVKVYGSEATFYYSIALGIVSMLFTIFGFSSFFDFSEDNNIGSHDEGMGLVLSVITLPLSLLELALIIVVFNTVTLSNILGTFVLIWFFEKIVQMVFYVLVRKCVHRPAFKDGAVFYFSFLSFLNFTMWLSSIPFTDIPLYDDVATGNNLWLVDRTFKALVIDYRLLCTLLFFEHAVALSEHHQHVDDAQTEDDVDFQSHSKRLYSLLGILVGCICLLLEIANGIQFWVTSTPYIVNCGPILVDTVLTICGVFLLRNVLNKIFHNENIGAVMWMVASLGVVSIVYLTIFSLLCIAMIRNSSNNSRYSDVAENYSYVAWSTSVFFVRAFSLSVLLVVYTGVPFSIMTSAHNHRPSNYFLTWALFGGMIARFIGSALDEFHGTMHAIAHKHLEPGPLRSLRDLFQIGPLLHLATCLHLALHFLLMIIRLMRYPKRAVAQVAAAPDPAPNDRGATTSQNYTAERMSYNNTPASGVFEESTETTRLLEVT